MFKAMEGRSASLGSIPRFRISRQSWAACLSSLLPGGLWRQVATRDPRRSDSRTRWSAKYLLLVWILMGWSVQPQATTRFDEAFSTLSRLYWRRRRSGRTYQGFVKASASWTTEALHALWRRLQKKLIARMQQATRWADWTVLVADGSRFDATRTRSNEKALKHVGVEKTRPQWGVTLLMHLPTGLLWDWRQGRAIDSERGQLRDMLDDLPEKTLLLADAGFTGFDLMQELARRGVTFLIRCGSNITLLVEDARTKIEGVHGSKRVYLWPKNRRSQPPLELRLIVFKHRKQRVCLLTNALDTHILSRSMASDLYRARWGVEIGYREIKQSLDRRQLKTRSARLGEAELAGSIVAWALLRLQACLLMGRHMFRLSMAIALRVQRSVLEYVRFGCSTAWFAEQMCRSLRDEYERKRPKKARDWPHKKKDSPPKPPLLRTCTNYELTRIQAFQNRITQA